MSAQLLSSVSAACMMWSVGLLARWTSLDSASRVINTLSYGVHEMQLRSILANIQAIEAKEDTAELLRKWRENGNRPYSGMLPEQQNRIAHLYQLQMEKYDILGQPELLPDKWKLPEDMMPGTEPVNSRRCEACSLMIYFLYCRCTLSSGMYIV